MKLARLVGVGTLCAGAAAAGCTEEGAGSDGGVDAAVDAGSPRDATVADTGVDAAADVRVDAVFDAGLDAPWCGNPVIPDASFDASGFDAAAFGPDAGPLCARGEWRNHAASTCVACPATAVTCVDLVGGDAGGSPITYSYVDRRLTVMLPPGRAQVMGGQAAVALSSCFGNDAHGAVDTVTAPVYAAGDALVVDLAGAGLSGGRSPCGNVSLTLLDACCRTSTVHVTVFTDSESYVTTSRGCPLPGDGGGSDAAEGG